MASDTSSMPFWIKFFSDAGIPAGIAANYAVTFTEHRIQEDMLLDLSKEYLSDMGVKTMGDVIAILRHAKTVHTKYLRDKALKSTVSDRMIPGTASPKRSTPASRTVNHYIGKDPEARPMSEPTLPPTPKISAELASRLGANASPAPTTSLSLVSAKVKIPKKIAVEEVPVPKIRRVLPEHEGPYKVIMPKGTTEKTKNILKKKAAAGNATSSSSVFDRLGEGTGSSEAVPSQKSTSGLSVVEQKVTITGLGKKIVRNNPTVDTSLSSVFSRLGGRSLEKRPASSTCPDSDDSEDNEAPSLEYAGVLKSTSMDRKKALLVKKKAVVAQRKKLMEKKRKAAEAQEAAEVSTTSSRTMAQDKLVTCKKTPISQRLGKQHPAPSSTSMELEDFPISKEISVRLGPQRNSPVSSTQDLSPKKLKITRTMSKTQAKTPPTDAAPKSGVFGRLGKTRVS